jgi:hypothetical protein
MNTITILVAVMTLWLVMGLGFLTAYADARRKGRSKAEAWLSNEGLLFMVSILVPAIVGIYRFFA